MSKKVTIYHQPYCSKCKEAMGILEGSNCEIEAVEYMKNMPTKEELQSLLSKLGLKPFDIIRTTEPVFEKKFKDKTLGDEEWLDVLIAHPILLQRPVLVYGDKAIIGRPASKIVKLVKD